METLKPTIQRFSGGSSKSPTPASAATLLEVSADPKHLGAQTGFLSILHTWGQTLTPHPHIHCVVPGGGLAPDHSRWVSPHYSFLLPVKVLSRVFRGKFVPDCVASLPAISCASSVSADFGILVWPTFGS